MVRSGIERDMTLIENVDFDLAVSPVSLLSIDMVDSMLKSCPSRISDSIGCDVSNAIHRCNQTRRVKTNLLDNGIGRYLASVGAQIALAEMP